MRRPIAIAAAACCGAGFPAAAKDFPTRAPRGIAAVPSGGPNAVVGKIVGPSMSGAALGGGA